jgi:hypothetical protein
MDKDRKKPYTEPVYDKRLLFGHFQGVGVPFSRVIVESHPFGWGILYPSHTKRTI